MEFSRPILDDRAEFTIIVRSRLSEATGRPAACRPGEPGYEQGASTVLRTGSAWKLADQMARAAR